MFENKIVRARDSSHATSHPRQWVFSLLIVIGFILVAISVLLLLAGRSAVPGADASIAIHTGIPD